jgi:hypothetical protein
MLCKRFATLAQSYNRILDQMKPLLLFSFPLSTPKYMDNNNVTIELQQVTHFCDVHQFSGYLYNSSIKPDLLLGLGNSAQQHQHVKHSHAWACQTNERFVRQDMFISSTPVKVHPLSALEVG